LDRRARNHFLIIHLCALSLVLLYPLYGRLLARIPFFLRGCLLHDWFRVYCPMCGGTRALEAMLRFDFAEALRYNLLVVLLAFALLAWDMLAFVRLLRKEKNLYRVPMWTWIALGAAVLVFGILRNLLMILWGIDPLGDLNIFWNH